jgi:hypothetical protein
MPFEVMGSGMQKVTLYGRNAAIFHLDKETFRAENGRISLPAQLVPNALAMGFSREPMTDAVMELELPDFGAIEAGEPIASNEMQKPEPAPSAPFVTTQFQPTSRSGPHGDPLAPFRG